MFKSFSPWISSYSEVCPIPYSYIFDGSLPSIKLIAKSLTWLSKPSMTLLNVNFSPLILLSVISLSPCIKLLLKMLSLIVFVVFPISTLSSYPNPMERDFYWPFSVFSINVLHVFISFIPYCFIAFVAVLNCTFFSNTFSNRSMLDKRLLLIYTCHSSL